VISIDVPWWREDLAKLDERLTVGIERTLRRRGVNLPVDLGVGGGALQAMSVLGEIAQTRNAPRSTITRLTPRSQTLTRLAKVFGLDEFALDVLVLALAVEVDPRYQHVLAFLQPEHARPAPSAGLAAELLWDGVVDEPWGDAFAPDAPLRRWRLITLDGDGPLPSRWFRLAPDLRHAHLATALPSAPAAHPRAELAASIDACAAWARAAGQGPLVVVQGVPGTGRDEVARGLAHALGRPAIELSAGADADAHAAAMRDARWFDGVVVIRELDDDRWKAVVNRLRTADAHVIAVAASRVDLASLIGRRPVRTLEVPDLDPVVRGALWSAIVGRDERAAGIDLSALAARTSCAPAQMVAAWELIRAEHAPDVPIEISAIEAALDRLPAPRIAGIARRLSCPYQAADLVVSVETQRELRVVRAWLEVGDQVRRSLNGVAPRGLLCLFNGPPGTGKTLAAQVLAREAGVDLFHVDLAQVVSKYVGETEKNLASLFDVLESRRALLFFDEADALFGRRTTTKDAHDRYANIETSYLLQRLDQYQGVVVLATNLLQNIDSAFLRRLQVVAEFPLPGVAERAQIWRRMLPAERDDDVEVETVARAFAITGADIRNAVASAALLAGHAGRRIGLADLVPAVCRELRKQGRLIDPSDFGTLGRYVREVSRA
jgi:AAA+ superfamily predicted ATPase